MVGMAGKSNDRSSRIRSFFENDIFLDELSKIKQKVDQDEEGYDLEVINLRKRWKLNWDYHETIVNYLETGQADYSLGDNDIRIIDYKAQTVSPSDAPEDEFRIVDSLKDVRNTGVHIKLPKDLNRSMLRDFINHNFNLIENALENNFSDRLPHQAPEQQTKRKVHIFRLYEDGVTITEIAKLKGCDPRDIRYIIKEYKEKIST